MVRFPLRAGSTYIDENKHYACTKLDILVRVRTLLYASTVAGR